MRRAAFVLLAGSLWPTIACRADPAAGDSAGALVWYAEDLHRRDLVLSHGPDRVLPAASIIKLLIAWTMINAVGRGEVALDDGITVRSIDRVGGSDQYGRVRPGKYPLRDLLGAMLAISDNTAANALLNAAGMDRCNCDAAALGLTATRIRRTFYDWEAQRHGLENTTTPRESAKLLIALQRRAVGPGRSGEAARVVMRALLAQTDRETIPAALPTRTEIANKTGELPGVRNDVAIVRYGQPNAYVVAIMSRFPSRSRHAAIRDIRAEIAEIDRRLLVAQPRAANVRNESANL